MDQQGSHGGAALRAPPEMVDREREWDALTRFATDDAPGARLGIIWGRRRIGKSYLLQALATQTGGLHFQAVRATAGQALADLGAALAAHQGVAGAITFDTWDEAIAALLRLGEDRPTVVILDELPYLLEGEPRLDSVIQRAYGPRDRQRAASRTRLVLCGSAITMMRELLSGTAPLRGRASLDLRMTAFDPLDARELHRVDDLETALRLYAIIGGVAAYARDMVADDLPEGPDDLTRWVCERVLSPAAPLSEEVEVLLSEDPTMAAARKPNLYHAVLAAVASGAHAHAKVTSRLRVSGQALAPVLRILTNAELLRRVEDPIRARRPRYLPADPLLRFHYALLRPARARLRRRGADLAAVWSELKATFDAQVVGPCFEDLARWWVEGVADETTLGGPAAAVGPTVLEGGEQMEIDVVVVPDASVAAAERTVTAIGEAKVGALTEADLARLEEARRRLGGRASGAKLLLFGLRLSAALRRVASQRSDVELVDLERLYTGS